MLSYQTLTGRRLPLHDLTPFQSELVQVVLRLREKALHDWQKDDVGRAALVVDKSATLAALGEELANRYAHEVRSAIRERCSGYDAFVHVLGSHVGDIFRDAYYRLVAQAFDPDGEDYKHFVTELRFNPARLLYDAYLDGTLSQRALAQKAKINSGTLSRLFTSILGQPRSHGITLRRLRDAFENLDVTPILDRRGPSDPPLVADTSGFTVRELQLCRLASALERLKGDTPVTTRVAALNLACTLGITDHYLIQRFTLNFMTHVLGDPIAVEKPAAESIARSQLGTAYRALFVAADDLITVKGLLGASHEKGVSTTVETPAPEPSYLSALDCAWQEVKRAYDFWEERHQERQEQTPPTSESAHPVRKIAWPNWLTSALNWQPTGFKPPPKNFQANSPPPIHNSTSQDSAPIN